MAHRAIVPAFDRIERLPFVRHDLLLDDRRSGVLEVAWRIEADSPVVIGAGWFELHAPPAPCRPPGLKRLRPGMRVAPTPRPEVVAEIVRRGAQRTPVLPGSSLKGAVRQVYELLTASCRPAVAGCCKVPPRDQDPRICPACSLFGAPCLGGRLSFAEASPVPGRWQVKNIGVPAGWQPRRDRPGTLKVYDQREAFDPRTHQDRPKREATWAVMGEFRSRIRVVNAEDEELGILLGALGYGAVSPMLRLGGKKFDGLGGADVELLGMRWHFPNRSIWDAEKADRWAADKVRRHVVEHPDRRRAWQELHEALTATGRNG